MTADVVVCPSCGVRNRVPSAATGVPRCPACHTDLPWLVDATDTNFDTAIDSRLPVLVDLWAPWCGPCRTLAPAVQWSSEEFARRLKVVKVTVDQARGVSARLGVQASPLCCCCDRVGSWRGRSEPYRRASCWRGLNLSLIQLPPDPNSRYRASASSGSESQSNGAVLAVDRALGACSSRRGTG
jgi:thioredoxin 2